MEQQEAENKFIPTGGMWEDLMGKVAFIQDFESGRTLMDGKSCMCPEAGEHTASLRNHNWFNATGADRTFRGHCKWNLQELTSEDTDTKMRNLCFILSLAANYLKVFEQGMIRSALFSRMRILLVVCKMEWRDGSLDNQAGTFESKDESETPSQHLRGGQWSR